MPGPTTLSPTQASPWPDPRQLLLLKASLLTGHRAALAWEQWKGSFRFEDPLDEGSFRILPLLYHNLRVLAPEDPLLPRLKGTWKQAWYRNQKLFHEGAAVLRTLHDQGIRTILLKGAALSLHYYDDIALRPMSDLDVLVPASQARQAIAVLTRHGWTAEDPGGLEYNLRYGRSMGFRRPGNAELDLHWHPFFELPDEASEGLWEHAIPLQLAGEATQALDPATALLHVIVHGIRRNPVPPIRWIPDSLAIIRKSTSMDWQRFARLVGQSRSILQVDESLRFLQAHFDLMLPEEARIALKGIPVGSIERFLYHEHLSDAAEALPEAFFPRIRRLLGVYLRQSHHRRWIPVIPGFLRFLLYRTAGKNRLSILWYYLRRPPALAQTKQADSGEL